MYVFMCLCVYIQSLNEFITGVMNSEYSPVFFFLEKCSVYDKETESESLSHTHTFFLLEKRSCLRWAACTLSGDMQLPQAAKKGVY